MVGRWLSFWDGLFSEAFAVSFREGDPNHQFPIRRCAKGEEKTHAKHNWIGLQGTRCLPSDIFLFASWLDHYFKAYERVNYCQYIIVMKYQWRIPTPNLVGFHPRFMRSPKNWWLESMTFLLGPAIAAVRFRVRVVPLLQVERFQKDFVFSVKIWGGGRFAWIALMDDFTERMVYLENVVYHFLATVAVFRGFK